MGGKIPHHSDDIETAIHGSHHRLSVPSSRPICPPPPKPWFSWFVPLIFMIDSMLFVYTMYVNNCPATTDGDRCLFSDSLGRFSFQPLSENRMFGPSANTLILVGGLQPKLVVKEGEGWRLLSCMWLHGGLIHLLANMISLLFIGVRLEQEFGFLKIGLLYVFSGLGGSLSSAIRLQSNVSVGASGALFGLLGAMLSELIMNWTIYSNKCAALSSLLLIVAINMAVGYIPGVDMSAHIGGFVSGFLLGFILLVRPQFGWVNHKYIPPGYDLKRVKPKFNVYQYLLWITSMITLISGYIVGLVKLYSGPTTN
ncbi:RHOMBOID-like protein 5 [Macadamia integrifolia]|uniref:RHOMBOID-like protein 5 n=1 Tax=Macadamia integrifolia TaxID=60698 RepID=UPI001C4FE770|nr:RHOMBOID-like protein 5 [Macadamia integrifolia]